MEVDSGRELAASSHGVVSVPVSRPGPLTLAAARALIAAGRSYARHTRGMRRPTGIMIHSAASVAAHAQARARAALIASFDEYSSSSDSDDSSSSSSEAPTDEEEEKEQSGTALQRGVRRDAAAVHTVSRSAGRPVVKVAAAPISAARARESRAARLKLLPLLTSLLGESAAPLVERAIFDKHHGVLASYTAHARELLSSLRVLQSDAASSTLLADIRGGRISPAQLVSMTTADLAPTSLREQRRADASEYIVKELVKAKEVVDESVAAMKLMERRRDEAASQQLEAAIQPQAHAAVTENTPSATAKQSKTITPSSQSTSLKSRGAVSEAEAVLRKFQTIESAQACALPPTTPVATSVISSDDSDESSSDDELLLIVQPPTKSPAVVTAKSTARATNPPPQPGKRKAVGGTFDTAASKRTRVAAGRTSPSLPALERADGRSATDVIELLSDTPTPPPSVPRNKKRRAVSTVDLTQPLVHPTDPIKIPMRPSTVAVTAYTGRLSVLLPRRGELPLTFHPLPTRDIFAASRGAHAFTPSLDCWDHILPSELDQPRKMKVSKLDTYISYKASAHATPSSSAAAATAASLPSSSIQAASRVYPISFVVRSTDVLLSDLFRDLTNFYETNQLAIALDYESSSRAPTRQASVWLIPPHSLHHVTQRTANEILEWEAAPTPDEWWGMLWVKSHAYAAMKTEIQSEQRLDVPSDDERRTHSPPSVLSAAAPTAPVPAVPTVTSSQQALQMIQNTAYLSSLLQKLSAPAAAAPPTHASGTPPTPAPMPPTQPTPLYAPHTLDPSPGWHPQAASTPHAQPAPSQVVAPPYTHGWQPTQPYHAPTIASEPRVAVQHGAWTTVQLPAPQQQTRR